MKTTEFENSPPKIIHSRSRPTLYRQMVTDAARNLHLRQQATALLSYYADQANGFRAALKTIEKHTKIPENKISDVRKRLIRFGLIAYQPKVCVYIDWERIKVYASLQKPLRLPQSKNYTFAPAECPRKKKPRKTLQYYENKFHINNERIMSPWEEKFYSILMQFTEDEYTMMVEAIRQCEFPDIPVSQIVDANFSNESDFSEEDSSKEDSAKLTEQLELPIIISDDIPF